MDSSNLTHKDKFSRGVVITTTIVTLLLAYTSATIFATKNTITIIVYLIILLVITLGVLCSMPLRLEISKTKITIFHPIGKTIIARKQIIETQVISKKDLKGSFRIFGSGGFMGWYGIFHNSRLGKFRLYSGDLENLHFIKTENKKYIISSSKTI